MKKSNDETKPSPKEEKKMKLELKKQFNLIKKRLKMHTKTELIAILWEQGLQYKQLQDISKELFEENKILKKEIENEKTDEKSS